MRSQIYTAIAYGARGILYFTYWTPEPGGGEEHFDGIIDRGGKARARYAWVARLNQELRRLGPLLMGLRSRGVYQVGIAPRGTKPAPNDEIFKSVAGGPATIGYFEGSGGRRYI